MLNRIHILIIIIMISISGNNVYAKYEKLAYDFNFKDLDGTNLSLSEYKNKIIVVVNVASKCGFTTQYQDMQKIKYIFVFCYLFFVFCYLLFVSCLLSHFVFWFCFRPPLSYLYLFIHLSYIIIIYHHLSSSYIIIIYHHHISSS